MQTAHFWYQLHLYRAKVIFLLLFLSTVALKAQSLKQGVTMHRLESDKKKVQYGFFLGAHQNYYGNKYSDAFETIEYDQISSINSQKSVGFNLGFMVNFRLDDQFTLRTVPVKIGLYQNIMDYNFIDGTVDSQLVESTRIEPGVYLKYRSIRRSNSRMYIVFGGSVSMRAGKEDLVTNSDRLEIARMNAKVEFGIGLENYFEYFKFAPEIRYARGMMDVLNNSNNIYHNGLNRITTHNFTLYLHFSD